MIDELLGRHGVKYEELTEDERTTFNSWLSQASQTAITVDKVKDYIHALKEAVSNELTKSDLDPNQDLFLKARLRNLMLIEAFLTNGERAQAKLEEAIANIGKRKKF